MQLQLKMHNVDKGKIPQEYHRKQDACGEHKKADLRSFEVKVSWICENFSRKFDFSFIFNMCQFADELNQHR